MACSGNAAEIYGRSDRLNIFYGVLTTPTTMSSPPSTTTAPVLTATPVPLGWSALGCYKDTGNIGERVLSHNLPTDNSALT